jgi:hypothetical protein
MGTIKRLGELVGGTFLGLYAFSGMAGSIVDGTSRCILTLELFRLI